MTTETPFPHPGPLADPEWLHRHLDDPGLRIVDVRSGADAFRQAHVPNAVHADYAAAGWRAAAEGAPGMLPPVDRLCDLVSSLGIGNGTLVVLVANGLTAGDFGNAARVYWTFKVLGHDRVTILRGGLAGWTSDPARPVEAGPGADPERRPFTASYRPGLRAAVDEVENASETGHSVLLDARSLAQHRGEEKSPAARVPGTIPGAMWLDWERLYSAGELKTPAGAVPEDKPVIAFCNTGHSAALAWFVLSEVEGRPDVSLYDGSMSHWTQDPSHPVVAGGT
ncbi:sulfurtransferase [Arenibaculum sp.]|jgi:thiosulfate/3-mercaptopyruvate sulfurtransferase|uniref:sulfurtransferase n=1 Tax=Arenibaculum sp. TaxID=2865862 RepID=UPI002E157A35|nr:sulfurtransferase [Arenibaculum sp.]